MIQRIQSVYLFIAAVLVALMFTLPLGSFISGTLEYQLTAWGIKEITGEYIYRTLFMSVLMIMAAVLPFVNIFLYKKRFLQLRLCLVEMILLVGVQVFVAFYLWRSSALAEVLDNYAMKFAVADLFPLAALFFTWMAFRNIARDEALVRSLDRIR